MISEEILQEYEAHITDHSLKWCFDVKKALISEVRELLESLKRETKILSDALNERDVIKQSYNTLFDKWAMLEKEADWLAENAGECPHVSGGSTFCWRHCPMWIGPRNRSGHCEKPDMREAARRAVSND